MALIRPATIDDAALIAAVHVASWRESYKGLVPEAMLGGLAVEDRTQRWAQILGPTADPASASAFVALQGGEPLGFIAGGAQRDTALAVQGFSGEISAIYVLQRAQNCGLGRRLMAAMARSLGDRGHGAASLWVLRDNAPARRFYERLGGMVIGEKEEPCGAVTLAETAYGWPDLAPLTDIGATPSLA